MVTVLADPLFNAGGDNPISVADGFLTESLEELDARTPETVDTVYRACKMLFWAAVAAADLQAQSALHDMEICL